MKQLKQFISTLAIGLCLITSPALASDYDTALKAYLDGNHQTAFALFSPLAEQGNPKAQYNLARQYRDRGDYIQAHQWANIAQFKGEDSAELLKRLEKSMSQADIRTAENKAQKCLESGYRDC